MDCCLPIALSISSPLQPLVNISSLVRVLQARKACFDDGWFVANCVVNLRIPVIVFRICVVGVEEMPDNIQGFIHVNTCNHKYQKLR